MIQLVPASIEYADSIIDFKEETLKSVKRISGGVGLESAERIEDWLSGKAVPHYGKVKERIYLAIDESGRMVGISDIRLGINEFISDYAGQIGYTVRPSERGKGYATQILKALIKEAKALGMSNILVTCNEDNIASSRVIEKAGGILESIIPHPGYPNVKRYRFI